MMGQPLLLASLVFSFYLSTKGEVFSVPPSLGDYNVWRQEWNSTTGSLWVKFTAKCFNDIVIALLHVDPGVELKPPPSSVSADSATPLYEIVFGGWANKESVLRYLPQGNNELEISGPQCDSNQYLPFWISYFKPAAFLSAGRGSIIGQNTLFEHFVSVPNYIYHVGYFTFTSWDKTVDYNDITWGSNEKIDCSSWFRATTANDDSFYRIFLENKNFPDARSACKAFGSSGDLAILRNKETADLVNQRVWIGLRKPDKSLTPHEAGWLWLDGSPLNTSITPWETGEPNNFDSEYRGIFQNGALVDVNVLSVFYYLCELHVQDCSTSNCPIGSFLNSATSRCELCSLGRYSIQTGSTFCSTCSEGKSTKIIGAISPQSCQDCPEGSFSHTGDPICRECPAGKFLDSNSNACTSCPAMTFGFNNYSHPCLPCPDGMFSASGSFTCDYCPEGTFLNSTSASVEPCQKCPPNTFSSEIVPRVCEHCPLGKYSEEGWRSCLPEKNQTYAIGCADGEREWFLNISTHPLIAGCSGAFQRRGLKKQKTIVNDDVTCRNQGGDDSPYPFGESCSASDLCAEGWHLCSDAVEVMALSGTGDCDYVSNSQADELFFASGQSSSGNSLCTHDGVDDVFGCGTMMEQANPACGPLDRIFRSKTSPAGSWVASLSSMESLDVHKLSSNYGGVLCCRDVPCLSCSEGEICLSAQSGCSDGSREWFLDSDNYPDIAGCAGGFDQPGLVQPDGQPKPSLCDRQSGNTGIISSGEGCSAADLCEAGWKVCDSKDLVRISSGGRFCDPSESLRNPLNSLFLFFAQFGVQCRYVRISRLRIDNDNAINLRELKIYSNEENVALGKNASGSSIFDNYYASKLVDGIDTSDVNMAHTMNTGDFEWFLIDLGGIFVVDKIIIFNRVGCCWARAENLRVELSLFSDMSSPITSSAVSPALSLLDKIFYFPGHGPSLYSEEEALELQIQGSSQLTGCGNIDSFQNTLSIIKPSILQEEWNFSNVDSDSLLVNVSKVSSSTSGVMCCREKLAVCEKCGPNEDRPCVSVDVNHPFIFSVLPQNGPSEGNEWLTLNGQNFGLSGVVRIGDRSCRINLPESLYSSTRIICKVPSLPGGNLSISVVNDKGLTSNNPIIFSVNPPSIESVQFENGEIPTTGGNLLSIFGENFGDSSVLIRVGENICIEKVSYRTHQLLVCILPSGQGASIPLQVTVTGKASNEFFISYDPPHISRIIGQNGNTSGGTVISLLGRNFGTGGTVRIDGKVCNHNLLLWRHSLIECILPAGVGANLEVVIESSGQNSTNTSSKYSYAPPEIVSIEPLLIDFENSSSTLISIYGNHFATDSQLLVDGEPIDLEVNYTDSSFIQFRLAPGISGKSQRVQIRVANQVSVCSSDKCEISVAPPRISSVSGCTDSELKTVSCPLISQTWITISGFNFGFQSVARVQGKTCMEVSFNQALSNMQRYVCALPNNTAGELNALVEMISGGQTGSARYLSYESPVFAKGTLRKCSSDISTHGVTGLPSSGQEKICFNVDDLPVNLNSSDVTIWYGPYRSEGFLSFGVGIWTISFDCSDPELLNSTTISCWSTKGIGRDLTLWIKVREQYTWSSNETLSYIDPVLVDGSIRRNDSAPSSEFISFTSMENLVVFDVDNLDISANIALSNEIIVRYGNSEHFPLQYVCTLVSIWASDPPTGRSTVACRTERGNGVNHVFQISALGSVSNISTFTFSYPQVPVVDLVRTDSPHCINSDDSSIKNCRTNGGQTITIHGKYFCNSTASVCLISIQIDSEICASLIVTNTSEITCILPAYTGESLPIVVVQTIESEGTFISAPKNLISYAPPEIVSVSGCTDDGNVTRRCSRDRETRITVFGRNFGSQQARVLIDGEFCQSVVHDLNDPHEELSCDLYPGNSFESSLSVLQYRGSISFSSSGKVYFEPCPIGTYSVLNSLSCPLCPIGKFNGNEGASMCVDCPAGKFSNINGSTVCDNCSPGSFSYLRATSCLSCPPGKFSDISGSSECALCDRGRYSDDFGKEECLPCDPGFYVDSFGNDSCKPCGAGFYTPFEGFSQCLACMSGFFSNTTASTACKRCVAGYRSSDTLGSSCCLACEISSYSSFEGSSKCFSCESGRYTSIEGSTECKRCQPGKFDSLKGLAYCENCAPGKFAPRSEAFGDCLRCYPGTYNSEDGSSSCFLCPAGKYQFQDGSVICEECPAGKIAMLPGRIECSPCEPGYVATSTGMDSCIACELGKYSSEFGASKSCEMCPAGKFAASNGSFICLECPLGKYSDAPGLSSCQLCTRGKFQSNPGQSTCEECEVGEFTSVPGQSLCLPCGAGKFNSRVGFYECSDCNPGQYQPSFGASECLNCFPGRKSLFFGSQSCSPCEIGRIANSSGSSTCTNCERGFFQPLSEQSNCLACPPGKFSFEESFQCAECGIRSVAPQSGQGLCIACPDKSETNAKRTECICAAGYYAFELLSSGNNESSPSIECIECPEGAKCEVAGVRWETLETRDGCWRASPNSTVFYQCQLVEHCIGGLSARCGGNREGVLCNRCLPGYEVVGTSCQKCSSASVSIAVFVIMVVLIASIIISMFYIVIKMDKHQLHEIKNEMDDEFLSRYSDLIQSRVGKRGSIGEEPSIEGAPPPSPKFVYKLKIMLGFFQISVALALTLDMPLPNLFKSFISTFNIANFDVVQWTRFGCVLPITFLEKHLIISIFPFGLVLCIYAGYLFPRTCIYLYKKQFSYDVLEVREALHRFQRALQKFYKLVLFSIFLVYPTVSANILKLYRCIRVEGTSYLAADFRINCDSEAWKSRARLNILFVVMFPVAVPLLYSVLLFRKRHALFRAENLVTIGFLYAAYSDDTWWFEILDVLTKLSLTSLLLFIPQDYRISAALLILLIFFAILMILRPYIRKGDDLLHSFVLVELLIMLIGAHVYRSLGKIDDFMDTILGSIFIAMTFGLIFFVVFQIIKIVVKKIKQGKPIDVSGSALEETIRYIRSDRRISGVRFSRNPLLQSTKDSIVGSVENKLCVDENNKDSGSLSSSADGDEESPDDEKLPKNRVLFSASR